ncbi:AAA family ATPase [Agromyces laixinhei]|uniref:AAA family ATPase n=1 Tax=Agromyces laixinhei TaxID=2585717 RepID=UPI0018DCF7F2|nr:ATP-binding protein [Agromyces laixinhei]
MARAVFMCGPAGSGKSTYARRLEAEGFQLLSIDREAWERGHRAMPLPPDAESAIVEDLRDRLLDLVRRGHDVVLDLSFWSRRMREEWRSVLAPTRVVPETVLVATDPGTALARVERRSAAQPDGFPLPADVARR